MKRIPLLLLAILFSAFQFSAFSQCTPIAPGDSAGISPDWEDMPCVVIGDPYAQVIDVQNFDSVQGILVEWIEIDTIMNVPEGLTYAINPTGQLTSGATACIDVTGTSNGPVGDYKLDIHLCVKVSLLPTPLCGPVDTIIATIEALTGPSDINFDFFLRVIGSDWDCPSGLLAGIGENELASVTELQISPNPFKGTAEVNFYTTENAEYSVRILNMIGKEVYTQNLQTNTGRNVQFIDAREMAPGVYFYNISDGKNSLTKRLVVSE